MSKIKFTTSNTIKQQAKSVQKVGENITPDFEAIARKVMETHADAFKKLAQAEQRQPLATMLPTPERIVERTHTIEKVSTKDKLARKHGKLLRSVLDNQVAQITDALSSQDELFHILRTSISKVVEQNDNLTKRLLVLEAQKPQEKHIVTETKIETIVKTTSHKLVAVGIVLSISLSIIAILTH